MTTFILLLALIAPIPEPQIQNLIHGLDHDAFNIREESQKELIKIGLPALPFLIEEAKSDRIESSYRSFNIIIQMDSPEALQKLIDAGYRSEYAIKLLNSIAIRKFSKDKEITIFCNEALCLMSIFKHNNNYNHFDERICLNHSKSINIFDAHKKTLKYISYINNIEEIAIARINHENLKYLHNVVGVKEIVFYGRNRNALDFNRRMFKKAVNLLQYKLPNVNIMYYQNGMLGVATGSYFDKYVVIKEIKSGSAADRIGIKVGDRVISVNGKILDSRVSFIDEIMTRAGGESITINLRRNGIPIIKYVILDHSVNGTRFY